MLKTNSKFYLLALLACATSYAAAEESKGTQLPYKLYLSSTFTGWGQSEQNELKYDASKGEYYLHDLKLGANTGAEPRRFKITGQSWVHQFGLGPNVDATTKSASTLVFQNHKAAGKLLPYTDMKDIYLDASDEKLAASGAVMADFKLKVNQENGSVKDVDLSIIEDVPPLGENIFLKVNDSATITATYSGHGLYSSGVSLSKGKNIIIISDDKQNFYKFKSAADHSVLVQCAQTCENTLKVDENYVYGISIQSKQDQPLIFKFSKLDASNAKKLVPHFDAQGSVSSKIFSPNSAENGGKVQQVAVSVKASNSQQRIFTLTSTEQQRDDKEKYRVVEEDKLHPQLHTQNSFFDALFSMAIDDLKLNSISAIRDGNYNNGESISCNCFETGEKWNYVWTRDLSYAANLGLAKFDVNRVVNSMLFKTSNFRESVSVPANIPTGTLQIIQDTGSGGSWPVSTDRLTWSLAVDSVLQNLTGDARQDFLKKAYSALVGTIEADRLAVFDKSIGLYGGEQSYMDWRTQTYAPWITNNLARMSASKALSTNVVYYHALELTSKLAAEEGDAGQSQRYATWANELKQKINQVFWLKDVGLYSTMTTSAEDPSPLYKYDMLGSALAIIYGVANDDQAKKIIENYPNTKMGVPVYYPQQPNVYVYHNRSMWPFVTGYALKSAIKVGNQKVADNAIQSLVRGAALNLSNMENLEWLTGKAYYDDGPAINSRRQLWSIGAYLGMVTESVFGIYTNEKGLEIKPFLTPKIVALMGRGKLASLNNYKFKNYKIDIQLNLPGVNSDAIEDGVYEISQVRLNNKPISSGDITEALLTKETNKIIVDFGRLNTSNSKITLIGDIDPILHDAPSVFSPEAPTDVKVSMENGKFSFSFNPINNSKNDQQVFSVFKNGKLVANKISTDKWVEDVKADKTVRNCFTVEAEYVSSGNKSQHSEPVCDDGKNAQIFPITDSHVVSNLKPVTDKSHYKAPVLLEWGNVNDELRLVNFKIDATGEYAVQILYNNRQHTIDSGVTNAVKTLTLVSAKGDVLAKGVVQMPNVKDQGNEYPLVESTEFRATLNKGVYQLKVGDYFNMSYLAANSSYKGNGGTASPINKASIAGFKIVKIY
jgi:hypothetical protein